jgi:hypothetical protein
MGEGLEEHDVIEGQRHWSESAFDLFSVKLEVGTRHRPQCQRSEPPAVEVDRVLGSC